MFVIHAHHSHLVVPTRHIGERERHSCAVHERIGTIHKHHPGSTGVPHRLHQCDIQCAVAVFVRNDSECHCRSDTIAASICAVRYQGCGHGRILKYGYAITACTNFTIQMTPDWSSSVAVTDLTSFTYPLMLNATGWHNIGLQE